MDSFKFFQRSLIQSEYNDVRTKMIWRKIAFLTSHFQGLEFKHFNLSIGPRLRLPMKLMVMITTTTTTIHLFWSIPILVQVDLERWKEASCLVAWGLRGNWKYDVEREVMSFKTTVYHFECFRFITCTTGRRKPFPILLILSLIRRDNLDDWFCLKSGLALKRSIALDLDRGPWDSIGFQKGFGNNHRVLSTCLDLLRVTINELWNRVSLWLISLFLFEWRNSKTSPFCPSTSQVANLNG